MKQRLFSQVGQPHHFYSPEDKALLLTYDGTWACILRIAQQIGVNPMAARQAANKLGRGNTRPPFSNHKWTEEERDIVRRDYRQDNESAQEIADRLGLSFFGVKGQVAYLGLSKVTDRGWRRPWTKAEDEKLAELLQQHCVRKVAKLMHRTLASVTVRAKRLHLSRRIRDGWFTKQEVGQILGKEHKWVQARIDRGELKATYHNEVRPHGPGSAMWHIEDEDLVRYIQDHLQDLNGSNVDLPTIVMLLKPNDRH
jgi:hypothetical protein